jgi:hypothetical protein
MGCPGDPLALIHELNIGTTLRDDRLRARTAPLVPCSNETGVLAATTAGICYVFVTATHRTSVPGQAIRE